MELSDHLDRFRGPLIGLIASWGVGLQEAAELAQDSFADAYLGRENCRGDWRDPDVFGKWLRGVARNKFRNWVRSRHRRRRSEVGVPAQELEAHAASADAEAPVNSSSESEAVAKLRKAIDALPAKQRQVVMMHYLEETPVREVAQLLGVSERAVEGRLYQARRNLKTRMHSKSSEQVSQAWIGRALLL